MYNIAGSISTWQGSKLPYAGISGCQGDVQRHPRLHLQPPYQHHQSNTHVRFPSPSELTMTHIRQQALPFADTELEVSYEYMLSVKA